MFKPRPLCVTRSALVRPPLGNSKVTSFPRIVSLGPIWIRLRDYAEATEGTPYYNENPKPGPIYRRQPGQEAFVEGKIKKHELLGS